MILLHVKHFLNQSGNAYFPEWFDELSSAIKQYAGVQLLEYAEDPDEAGCINLWLQFDSQISLDCWRTSQTHNMIVRKLDPFRIKPYTVKKYNIAKKAEIAVT